MEKTTLESVFADMRKPQPPHLIVKARAGTGKTTTLVEGLKIIKGKPTKFTPSAQQALIWEAMQLSSNAKSTCFVAFDKSIATELQKRVPSGCDAMTIHSMGFRSIRNAYGPTTANFNRVQDAIAEILEQDIWDLRRDHPTLIKATQKLVGLCKMNLTLDCIDTQAVWVDEALADLASRYDVDLNGEEREVFALVPLVLEWCKEVSRDGGIDFDDMIWLPVVLDLPVTKYDLLLVDEAQDLNRCQQQLALKAGKRLILVGDPRQAIYGFAGADSKSMERMQKILEKPCSCEEGFFQESPGGRHQECQLCGGRGSVGVTTLPLTVTRRCGKAIVEEARKIVPDFEAHETCCEGFVHTALFKDKGEDKTALLSESCYRCYVGDGDMILCRVNAPLVSECFKFLKAGRKANIQGRDVGQGLVSTVKKVMKTYQSVTSLSDQVGTLLLRLRDWLHRETTRENAKKFPSEARLITLQDRYDCLCCFCEDQNTVEDVIKRIEDIFTDDKKHGEGIKLSSVHKAKGLEADRVFILLPENAGMPHPMSKTKWQIEQEWNLKYVAITRAISELVYVT